MVHRLRMWTIDTAWAELSSALGLALWGWFGLITPGRLSDQTFGPVLRIIPQTQLEVAALIVGVLQGLTTEFGSRSQRASSAALSCGILCLIVYCFLFEAHLPTRAIGLFASGLLFNWIAVARNVQYART